MAITNITDLTEIQASELTNNDLIAVGTSTGWKKIKANALGGGGAEDFVVEFSITMGDPLAVTSNKTYAEVYAAYQQGQNIKGKATLSGVTGDTWLIVAFVGVMPPSTDTTIQFFSILGGGAILTVSGSANGWTGELIQ